MSEPLIAAVIDGYERTFACYIDLREYVLYLRSFGARAKVSAVAYRWHR